MASIGVASLLPKLFVQAGATSKVRSNFSPTTRLLVALSAALVVGAIALGSLMLRRTSRQVRSSQSDKFGQAARLANGIATVQELAEPWSSKTFTFYNQEPGENVSALVIRLPDGAPEQPGSYWAFSIRPLFGHCQLEYITDLQKLSDDYKFEARHPMVGDPCSRAVFDPLQMADMPKGAWARGAIVKGSAFRPPLGIEIHIQSDRLVAEKME
jgi:hypothetical protein